MVAEQRVDHETGEILKDGDEAWRAAVRTKLGEAVEPSGWKSLDHHLPPSPELAHKLAAQPPKDAPLGCGCAFLDAQGRPVADHRCCVCHDATWIRTMAPVHADPLQQRTPCPRCV